MIVNRLPSLFTAFWASVVAVIREAVIQLVHPAFVIVAVENLPRQAILKHPFLDLRCHRYWRDRALVGAVAIQAFFCLTQLALKARYLLTHKPPFSKHFEVNAIISDCHLPPCSPDTSRRYRAGSYYTTHQASVRVHNTKKPPTEPCAFSSAP